MGKLDDLNNNGVPDYKEKWFYRALWSVFGFFAKRAPPHTIVHRAWKSADDEVSGALR